MCGFMKKLISLLLLIFILGVVFSSTVFDVVRFAGNDLQQDVNAGAANKVIEPQIVLNARADIVAGELVIKKIADVNLPTERVSDLLLIAKNSLDEAISIAVVKKSIPELSSFKQRMNDFTTVSQLVFTAHDELLALRERIDKARTDVKDLSSVETIYSSAEKELIDQRFERVMDLIQKADDKIIELTSLGTRAEVIYDAAASNIRNIVMTYWKEISLAILIPFIMFLVFRIKIRRMRLHAKINSLTIEKNVLLEEIKKAQNAYFVKGTIPDSVYTTKVNVFSEMIRDIAKEISLLKEQEEKINTKKAINIAKKKQKK